MPTPASDPDSWKVLQSCRAFAALPPSALRDILEAAVERRYEQGATLIGRGDPPDGLFLVLDGSASATVRDDERQHSVGRFGRGDVVGEIALVTREPRIADVIAQSAVRALMLPVDAFERLAARYVELSVAVTNLVAERLGSTVHDGLGGKVLDAYRIVRCVGRGGMAIVYEATDERTGERVALKMMSHRLIYDPAALRRFREEAAVVQTLHHENIASLATLFPAYRTWFLVMEFCDGENLSTLIRTHERLRETQVRRIIGQLAAALDHVHRRGVIHRDVKPSNVMLTRSGVVKLADFGIAISAALADETGAASNQVLGTPAFMSPEQLAALHLDSRADSYALGCVAYEMLTGRRLFTGTNLFDLVQQKLTLQLPPAAEIGDGISGALYDFLKSALHPDRNQRLSSVEGLIPWAGLVDMERPGASRASRRLNPGKSNITTAAWKSGGTV